MQQIFLEPIKCETHSIERIYAWKNDPLTRHFSFNQNPLSLEQFKKSFQKKFHAILELPPEFIFFRGAAVGVIYYEPWYKDKCCQISIFLDPKFLHQKIGSQSLQKAISSLTAKGYEEIIALIKPDNLAAKKAFAHAGFLKNKTVQVFKYNQYSLAEKYTYNCKEKTSSVFIIAEAGSNWSLGNHQTNLSFAKTMIEEAYKAGANAIKFQLYDSKRIYVPNAGVAGYLGTDINEIFKTHALSSEMIEPLVEHANYVGIEWMCSSFSEFEFDQIDPYVSRHKIASYELRHIRLLEKAAASQKPLFLSTGASTEEDIAWALSHYQKHGGKNITLMHCTAQYPAEVSSLHLNCIKSMQERFKVPIALSDHSRHPLYAPIAAVALGAVAIEKHFTFHRKLTGPDHYFSINNEELKEMCQAIRETEKILGVAKKDIFPQEEELAAFARRGLQASLPISEGDIFKEGHNIAILRPGLQKLGLHPKFIEMIEGKRATRAISLGSGIDYEDIAW